MLHGSYVAFVVDETSTQALAHIHPSNKRGVSVTMSVSYLQPVPLHQEVTVKSSCKQLGATMAFLETVFLVGDGDVVAEGRHTKFVG